MNTVAQQLAATAVQSRTDVQSARDAAHEAADLVDALEERVRAGESVQAAELANARELARIAELRVEAAERVAEQAQTKARHRAYAAYGDTVAAEQRGLDALEAEIVDAFGKARALLGELWELAGRRTDHLDRVQQARGQVLTVAQQHGETAMLPKPVAGRPAAPGHQLAALPLAALLVDKGAEHRLSGAYHLPFTPMLGALRLGKAEQAFPHLAPPTVEHRVAQLRQEQRTAGAR